MEFSFANFGVYFFDLQSTNCFKTESSYTHGICAEKTDAN